MTDKKISELVAATSFSSSDVVPISQGAFTRKASIAQLRSQYCAAASTGYAQQKTRAGDVTITTTAGVFVDVDQALDVVVNADLDDLVMLAAGGCWQAQNVPGSLNAFTVVAGSPVSQVFTGAATVPGWFGPANQVMSVGGPFLYAVKAADIDNGQVRFRLRATLGSNGSRVLGGPILFSASNLG